MSTPAKSKKKARHRRDDSYSGAASLTTPSSSSSRRRLPPSGLPPASKKSAKKSVVAAEDAGSGRLRVGITGAAGRVGSLLVEALEADDAVQVVAFRLGQGAHEKGIDFSDPAQVSGAFSGLDMVVHLAAYVDAGNRADWWVLRRNNLDATQLVLDECVRSGVKRCVYTSDVPLGLSVGSDTECGGEGADRTAKLSVFDPLDADSLYAVTKLCGEQLGRFYARRHGLEVVSLRLGWVPKQRDPTFARGTPAEAYMRALYCSYSDCVSGIAAALRCTVADEFDTGPYATAFVTSNNKRSPFDLAETTETLQWTPSDSADDFQWTD